MNRERILRLADHLEHEVRREEFDMSVFFRATLDAQNKLGASTELDATLRGLRQHACGTSACIAGHAVSLFQDELGENELRMLRVYNGVPRVAAIILGMTDGRETDVFYSLDIQSTDEAARALRDLVDAEESES